MQTLFPNVRFPAVSSNAFANTHRVCDDLAWAYPSRPFKDYKTEWFSLFFRMKSQKMTVSFLIGSSRAKGFVFPLHYKGSTVMRCYRDTVRLHTLGEAWRLLFSKWEDWLPTKDCRWVSPHKIRYFRLNKVEPYTLLMPLNFDNMSTFLLFFPQCIRPHHLEYISLSYGQSASSHQLLLAETEKFEFRSSQFV